MKDKHESSSRPFKSRLPRFLFSSKSSGSKDHRRKSTKHSSPKRQEATSKAYLATKLAPKSPKAAKMSPVKRRTESPWNAPYVSISKAAEESKHQKDLDNEREKSRIIHDFIAKSKIPLYNIPPQQSRSEKVRSWFLESNPQAVPQPLKSAKITTHDVTDQRNRPEIIQRNDFMSRSRSDQLGYNKWETFVPITGHKSAPTASDSRPVTVVMGKPTQNTRPKVIACGLVAQRARLFEQKIEENRIMKEDFKSGTERKPTKDSPTSSDTKVAKQVPKNTELAPKVSNSQPHESMSTSIMTSSIESATKSTYSSNSISMSNRSQRRSFLDPLISTSNCDSGSWTTDERSIRTVTSTNGKSSKPSPSSEANTSVDNKVSFSLST